MNKLSSRLLFNTAVVLLLVIALTAACYIVATNWGTDYMFKAELEGNAAQLSEGVQFDEQGRFQRIVLPEKLTMVFEALQRDYFYRVLDGKGDVLASSGRLPDPVMATTAPHDPGEVRTVRDGLPVRILTIPLLRNGHQYYVQSGRSERLQKIMGTKNMQVSAFAAAFAAVVATLVFSTSIWLTIRRAMRPLLEASLVAARIEPTKPELRLSEAGMPDEILPLIKAFNAALARLEDGYRLQQEFMADAAHELKTPLTLMRAQLEFSHVEESASLMLDVDRMGRQVKQLLDLAECSGQQNYQFETVELVDSIDDVAAHLTRLGSQRSVAIDVVTDNEFVLMRADRGALFVLLKNLIENAIQHSQAGSVVVVNVGASYVIVRNTGPAIPGADLALVFKRFWRGAHRRDDGAGLGLSICMEIAIAHGWQINAVNVKDGVEFKVNFPSVPAPVQAIDPLRR